MMINEITLRSVLPNVFDELRDMPHIRQSQVWLKDVTFTKPTDYLIFAESGTGKSSFCTFVYGARHDFSGHILFDGRDTSRFTPREWSEFRRRSLAYLPQQLSLFPELTAMENIQIKNRLTNYLSVAQIKDMLERLGIPEKANWPARLLSIGQQQRVAIVRALAQPFDFLLLDEPVSHLDARNNATVAEIIRSSAQLQGASIIATSVGNHISLPIDQTLKL